MKLLMDVGNSCVKWVCLTSLDSTFRTTEMHITPIKSLAGALQQIESTWHTKPADIYVAHMGGKAVNDRLTAWAQTLQVRLHRAEAKQTCLGLSLPYDDPTIFGVDRFLDMLAAMRHCEKSGAAGVSAFAVFDAGTALTLDVVDEQGHYAGGFIVPGLQLSGQSLLSGTAGCLQAGETQQLQPELGFTTSEQIDQGCFSMSLDFIRGRILALRTQFDQDLPVFLTGGDSSYYAPFVSDAQWIPTLVLEGLQRLALEGGVSLTSNDNEQC